MKKRKASKYHKPSNNNSKLGNEEEKNVGKERGKISEVNTTGEIKVKTSEREEKVDDLYLALRTGPPPPPS